MTQSAIILGEYGMGPWGTNSGFVDKTANWIWNNVNAASNAHVGSLYFLGTYNNHNNEIINATVHSITDNSGLVWCNGTPIGVDQGAGWLTTSYSKLPVKIKTGNNNFQFDCYNSGLAAGLIYSIIDDANGNVLMHSDARTICSTNSNLLYSI
jgi:hypothetical protein